MMQLLMLTPLVLSATPTAEAGFTAEGYRGIWYWNQKTEDEYVYKYSGGLGTYCAKHIPLAVYAPEAHKTFFVYGGTDPENSTLFAMVSAYDHATHTVPRPTVLMDKETTDAHDNPVIALDSAGHVWVFVSSHGTTRPSFIFKSRRPHDVSDFERVIETNFSYPQPWWLEGQGFFFIHTRYGSLPGVSLGGRQLYWSTSPDGVHWSEGERLAMIDQGHYQVSWPWKGKVGTAFNYHPRGLGLNYRTNLYYGESRDFGKTWVNVRGETLETPLVDVNNPALLHDYEAEGLKVYMKDLNYDAEGRPLVLHLITRGFEPGPENGPRIWRIAHWTGTEWVFHDIAESDSNYDTGCLHVEDDGTWRVIGPTETGPQPYNPGGEMAMWTSTDQGATWTKVRQMTAGSRFNHTYARRPVNAHPGFYAFWADGHGREPSESRLYFCTRDGDVYRLPWTMEGGTAAPERVE